MRTAPVAPKKEQVLRVVNRTSILIYPSAWQSQAASCPISKLTIEYRSSSQHKWKLLSSQGISDEVIELSNLMNRSIYSLRMTAHTRSPVSGPTMAEYEARIGIEDPADHEPYSDITKGLLADPSTVISLASSLFVLCVGFIAVACLVAYKRRLNQKLSASQRHKKYPPPHRTSATSAASTMQSTVLTEEDPSRRPVAGMAKLNIQKTSLPPIPVDVVSRKGSGMGQQVVRGSSAGGSAQGSSITMMDSQISGNGGAIVSRKSPFKSTGLQSQSSNHHKHQLSGDQVVRGKLPAVCIPRKQLEEIENDIYNEYDEITPYATFRLHDDPDHHRLNRPVDHLEEEEFKTFTVRIGEPAYLFKVSLPLLPF